MDVGELFRKYWVSRGRYNSEISNPGRFSRSLQDKLNEFTELEEIDWYVSSLRTRRESTRRIMADFFDYLHEKEGINFASILAEKQYYDYPFERQLEMAKFLHKKRTLEEIDEKFDIDGRTRRADLKTLEDGISIMGAEISIEKSKMFYKSTLHPIFLPLNLTQVYALTTYLDQLMDVEDPNAQIIREISAQIKSQLSDYATEKLFGEVQVKRATNNYQADEDMAKKRKGILMYLIKSGQSCEFEYHGQKYVGNVQYRRGQYTIRLTDGSVLDADIRDVIFDTEKLEYK